MRGITDPLMVSTYVLFVPALVWAAGGFWVESVLLFLSTAWATEYHRLKEPTGLILSMDKTLAVIALCATLGRFLWLFLWLFPHGAMWFAAVLCAAIWAALAYAQNLRAHKSGDERLYEVAHLRWHISVLVGQCVLALACYSQ